jgi:hypothetical protein
MHVNNIAQKAAINGGGRTSAERRGGRKGGNGEREEGLEIGEFEKNKKRGGSRS